MHNFKPKMPRVTGEKSEIAQSPLGSLSGELSTLEKLDKVLVLKVVEVCLKSSDNGFRQSPIRVVMPMPLV